MKPGISGAYLLPDSAIEEENRSAHLVSVLLWALMAGVALFIVAAGFLTHEVGWGSIRIALFLGVALVALLILNRTGRTRLAATLLVVLMWAAASTWAALGGGLRSPTPAIYLVTILVAGLLLSPRAGLLTAVLLSVSAVGIVGAEVLNLLPDPPTREPRLALWLIALTTVGGICAIQLIAVRSVRGAQRRSRDREGLLARILENLPVGVWLVDESGRLVHRNQAAQRIWGGGRLVDLADYGEYRARWLTTGKVLEPNEWASARAVTIGESSTDEEIEIECFDGSRKIILNSAVPLVGERDQITGAIVVNQDITARKQAEEMAREHLATLTVLHAAAAALAGTMDSTRLAEDVTRACVQVFGAATAWVGLARSDGSVHPLAQFPPAPTASIFGAVRWDDAAADRVPTVQAIRAGVPAVVCDVAKEAEDTEWRTWAIEQGFRCAASFPLISRGKPFGSLTLYSRESSYATPERIEVFQTYAHEVAAAMANARLFEETERRLRHVQALRKIDRAITASLDQRVTFDILLDQVRSELRVDAADILLLEQSTLTLNLVAGSGFVSRESRNAALRLGEDEAGTAALERRTVIRGVAPEGMHTRWASLGAAEGFEWRAATPLITKGEVKGVLEVFCRSPRDPDEDWLAFLETLAGQAALAVDSASLFDELQRSNVELKLAYDATIEGWSRALDLRDRETEGHTQRVVELTVRLARAMKMKEEDLVHLRRGALLHDIGKMGVPDSILHKTGPLTEEEREVMRRHTTHALDLLHPIRYLRPAIDIPYGHHEKWDGTGYPRGRKGEQIPLAARIFSVVDVWDALSSDRPYRAAWTPNRVREHIRSLAGTDFDPQVVESFLALDLAKPSSDDRSEA